jgi:glutathione peroxidase
MISKLFFSAFMILLFSGSSVYEYSVPLIEGGSQSLSAYEGKKLLVVTLPLIQNASADSLLYSLDTLATAHAADMKVIATPAYEDGYTPAQKSSLQNWYRSKLGSHVILTDGLYTRKSSGSQQHALYKWVTHADQNGRFDMDITEAETKFFINTDGKIYGVLRPQTKMWGQTLNRVINSPIVTEE